MRATITERPCAPVEEALGAAKASFSRSTCRGALQVMQRRPDAISVFIAPPSYAELKRRLAGRGDTPPDIAARRLHIALEECRQAKHYQYTIINDSVRARRAGAGSSPDRGGLPHILSPTQSQGGRLIMLYPAMADLLKHIDSRYLRQRDPRAAPDLHRGRDGAHPAGG